MPLFAVFGKVCVLDGESVRINCSDMARFVVSPWQAQCQVNKNHSLLRAFFHKAV